MTAKGYTTLAMAAEVTNIDPGRSVMRLKLSPMNTTDGDTMPDHLNVFATRDIGAIARSSSFLHSVVDRIQQMML